MSNRLPSPQVIEFGNIENAYVYITNDKNAPSGDPSANWAVEFVIAAGPNYKPNVTKIIGSGVTWLSESPPKWKVLVSRSDLDNSIVAGTWYWYFNRTDSGSEFVIARGTLIDTPISSGTW